MVYIRFIPPKDEYEGSYHKFCHSEGMELLRYALQKEYSHDFSAENIRKGQRGKPYIENVPFYFNISHCDGLVACAVSEKEVGIDAEVTRNVADRVMKRCYSDDEIAYVNSARNKDFEFTKLWTLKESYVKLTGEGIAANLKAISFDMKKTTAFSEDVSFSQIVVNERYIISICKKEKSSHINCNEMNVKTDGVTIINI